MITTDLAGRKLTLETGFLALQAHGAVTVTLGETVVLVTVVMNDTPREGQDFFPLTCEYEERYYATGKIKGSRFIKREGRPSDNAVLTARLMDRPLRPLFPYGMTNDVQVIATVLSADMEVDPSTSAIIGASAALMISGIPFNGPIAAVRIGLITDSEGKDQLIVNPSYEQSIKGKLNLVVAGTMDAITMVEAAASEVDEETMLAALELAHKEIKQLCTLQKDFAAQFKPKPKKVTMTEIPAEVKEAVKSVITTADLDTVTGHTKGEVKERVYALEEKVLEKYAMEIKEGKFSKSHLKGAFMEMAENRMRENILQKETRVDGRKTDEIRPIEIHLGIMPRTHGSALFQRGETQALTLTTLGGPGAAQTIDTMDEDSEKRYIHHYNFPPFSVGEARPLRGTSRREIGHGDLAERALLPVLPPKETFPYAMRLVSEVVSCNGSSSMASVCGSSLSLMDAGVPLVRPIAGIAMGLVTDDKGNYKILTDIQGMEDFAGDMDFKVAGSEKGITALQMDIKISGLSTNVMREALERAKKARMEILEKMNAAIPQHREKLSPYAPMIVSIRINPDQIRDVIGRGGETIKKITAETGCEIDIEQDGLVMITSLKQENGEKALAWVQSIVYIPKAGETFEGTVTRMMEFGAFVEFAPGKEGLVHISQLAPVRVNRVEDVVKVGDKVRVKLMEIDDQGRYNLSRKMALTPEETATEQKKFEGMPMSAPQSRPQFSGKPPHRSGPPRR